MHPDAGLIRACNAALRADAEFHKVCEDADEAAYVAAGTRRGDLVKNMLAMRAAGLEGARAKAAVVAAIYDGGSDDLLSKLIVDLLADLLAHHSLAEQC